MLSKLSVAVLLFLCIAFYFSGDPLEINLYYLDDNLLNLEAIWLVNDWELIMISVCILFLGVSLS
jgi:hypothetical protein